VPYWEADRIWQYKSLWAGKVMQCFKRVLVILALTTPGLGHGENIGEVELGDLKYLEVPLEGAAGEEALAAADLNGDGRPEIVVASQSQSWLRFYQVTADENVQLQVQVPTHESPNSVQAVRMPNGAGWLMVIPDHETEQVSVLRADGHGAIEHTPGSPFTVETDPHAHFALLADLDKDGQQDLLVDDRQAEGVRIYPSMLNPATRRPSTLVNMGGDP
jgi:hypothetical protein